MSRFNQLRSVGTILAFAIALTGCSTVHYSINAPLVKVQPDVGYRMQGLVRNAGDDELFIVLTFSGGGSRAAALAYGVLEELARHNIVWRGERKRLLDEVDLVFGVSGGSITAAYYALVGERIFSEFEPRFLARDLQSQLIDNVFSWSGFWRLSSPRFGRGELLQERLDDALFKGANFADLAARRSGPFTVISAADMGSGARFDFTQEYFDLLCSDLARFPLARAVAASTSVPLVFTPITLWNYAGDCGYQPSLALAEGTVVAPRGLGDTRAQQLTRDLASFLDRGRRPYIHLIDGGVADNLALRGLLEVETLVGGSEQLAQTLRLQRVRKALFVLVDAGTDSRRTADASADTPALLDVIDALTDIPIRRLSGETHLQINQALARWRKEVDAKASGGAPPVELYFVDVALRALADDDERRELLALPTTLFLPEPQVRRLRDAAARMVREDPGLQRLLIEIGARAVD